MSRCCPGLVVLFTLIGCVAVCAQPRIGLLAGLNVASVNIEEPGLQLDDSRTGLALGGVLDFNISRNAVVRIEPMYLQKGAKDKYSSVEGTVDVEWNLAYLEVPVYLLYELGTGPNRPYILVGPTVGVNLDSELTLSQADLSIDMDMENVTTSFDFGLGFGGGMSFPMGANRVFVEGRYVVGLTSISEEGRISGADEFETIDWESKTRGIQVLAGITFPLGR